MKHTLLKKTIYLLLCAGLLAVLAASFGSMRSASAAGTSGRSAQPEARNGVLDLSDGRLSESGWVALNGEWEFYWNELLNPQNLKRSGGGGQVANVPGVWSEYAVGGRTLTNQGYATYRLSVELANEDSDKTLAIYIPSVATAYRLWIDGRLAGSKGTVGTSAQAMIPKNIPDVYYFRPDGDDVDIVVQVSNFVQRKGGLWEEIRFGYSDAVSKMRNRRVLTDVGVFSCILIMALYHLGLYAFRRKDLSPQYFAGICLAICARTSVLGETLAIYLFPGIPWEAGAKTEYISAFCGMFFLLSFTLSQYPREGHKLAQRISLLLHAVCIVLVLSLPASVYTVYFVPYMLLIGLPTVLYVLYIYILAALRKKEGSVLNGIGFLLLSLTIANDVLFYTQRMDDGNFIPFGLLALLFTQSMNVAGKFSRSFGQMERLSVQLRKMNESLEEKVEERTEALRDANETLATRNRELSSMERSRRQLLSAISHELGTPLTSIQGYVKLMMDGILPDKNGKALQLIYDKTLYLDRIISDLFELSKLEAKQLPFHFQQVAAEPFFREMAVGYTWNGEGTKVVFEAGEWNRDLDGAGSEVRIDPIRIEQVFANLLTNANKFTPPDGTIRIGVVSGTMPGTGKPAVKVEVSDTGPGIAEEELLHVFERFYQGAASRSTRNGGSGLGLAISKQIVEQHHGVIGVHSAPAQGSTFYFILPLC